MPATLANISKGRVNQFARAVNAGSGGEPAFVVMLLQSTGLQALAALRDHATFAAVLGATNTECSVASYSRLVLDNTNVGDPTVDNANNRQDFDTDDFSFGSLEEGQDIAASVIGFRPAPASPDGDIIVVHISIPASVVPTNGETFHWRTPNGLWSSREPA